MGESHFMERGGRLFEWLVSRCPFAYMSHNMPSVHTVPDTVVTVIMEVSFATALWTGRDFYGSCSNTILST